MHMDPVCFAYYIIWPWCVLFATSLAILSVQTKWKICRYIHRLSLLKSLFALKIKITTTYRSQLENCYIQVYVISLGTYQVYKAYLGSFNFVNIYLLLSTESTNLGGGRGLRRASDVAYYFLNVDLFVEHIIKSITSKMYYMVLNTVSSSSVLI